MTAVSEAVAAGKGKILAQLQGDSHRLPGQGGKARPDAGRAGIRGILTIGSPNTPLLEVPVSIDKAGIVIIGGLYPWRSLRSTALPRRARPCRRSLIFPPRAVQGIAASSSH